MGPEQTSFILNIIADGIAAGGAPSRAATASDLGVVLAALDGSGGMATRVAILDFLKKVKRKVFDTKGEQKILEKLDRLKVLKKKAGNLAKEIRDGENFADIAKDKDFAEILAESAEFMQGGSEALEQMSGMNKEDATAVLDELDDFYTEEEDAIDGDRAIMVKAVSQFLTKADERIKKLEGRLEGQKKEQKKGKELGEPKEEPVKEKKLKRRGPKSPVGDIGA